MSWFDSDGGSAAAPDVQPKNDCEANHEVGPCHQDCKPVIPCRCPRNETICDRAQYGGYFDCQSPQSEKLGGARRRTQISHKRAASGLTRSHADTDKIGCD